MAIRRGHRIPKGRPANNEMQRTKHGPNGASPLISVFGGRNLGARG
jgi:hypothetical protein